MLHFGGIQNEDLLYYISVTQIFVYTQVFITALMQFFKVVSKAMDKLKQISGLVFVADLVLILQAYYYSAVLDWGIVGVMGSFLLPAVMKALGIVYFL